MTERLGDGASPPGREIGRTLVATIGRATIPALVIIMLSVTGVSVVLGVLTLMHVGADDAEVLRAFCWIVFWTGLSEGIGLAFGIVVVLFLARRIARPLGELAARADSVTARGGTVTFPTDTNLAEVNRLAVSFNRLFAVQERRIHEIRELSSHVLHDIKTPIARIRSAAELVFLGKGDSRESCRRIVESCRTVLALVDTNAAISRTYAGADLAAAEDVDMSALVGNVADLYSGFAEEKAIRLDVSLPDAPVRLHGHPHRLQGLVANLLDNALKYTDAGGRIGVSVACGDGRCLAIVVSDTGMGIPPQAMPHIFERFFRAESSRHAPGFGLGLSLVHAVVVSYGGTIACDSVPGKGTTFTVRLPLPLRTGP